MKLARIAAMMAVLISVAAAQTPPESTAKKEVTALLREFLDAAGRGEPAVFEKFFADDVIYTRATGAVIHKTDIMEGLGNLRPTAESKTTYSGDDITVHEYGDTMVVAFRLVGRTDHPDGKTETTYYRNMGTFLRRGGRWQVVAWQATKISDVRSSQ